MERVILKAEVDPFNKHCLKLTPIVSVIPPIQPRTTGPDIPIIPDEPDVPGVPGDPDLTPPPLPPDVDPEEPTPEPEEVAFEDNSVYEIDIKGIRAINSELKKDIHVKYITAPTPCYVELKDVTSLANGLQLEDESVLYHIREACRYADFIIKKHNSKAMLPHEMIELNRETIIEEYYEIYMFVKYKALRDCLLDFYIKEAAKPNRIKNQTGDLMYEHEFDLDRIKKLLDKIEQDYDDLEKEFVSKASPRSALRGKYSNIKYYPTNYRSSGYNRDTYPTGFDVYPYPKKGR